MLDAPVTVTTAHQVTPGREEEFQAWARAHEPDEYAYLRPNGRIDPSGDRAPRTRALLLRWREAIGLPELAEARP